MARITFYYGCNTVFALWLNLLHAAGAQQLAAGTLQLAAGAQQLANGRR